MELQALLQQTYFGNTVEDYAWFVGMLLLGLVFKKLISKYFSHLLYRLIGRDNQSVSVQQFDDLLTKPIGFCIMLSIIYAGSAHIEYPAAWDLASKDEFGLRMIVRKGYSLTYIISYVWIFLRLVDYFGLLLKSRAEQTDSKMDDQLVPFALEIGKIAVYTLGFFIILGQIFEVDVTALATGLGIGGIAIAMASKESLENLLGSFTIFFDKPFTVGDIVTAGSVTGVVEKVGFRSTRIRTFDKSIVTVPNKNMISAELDNLGERPVRRAKFMVGLTYDAKIEQIKAIVADIQAMIDEHPHTNQDGRVRFQEFGSSSLDIMVMYYVASPNWDDFIDTKQDINLRIMEIVQKHGCDFAFPSTTVYLQREN
jgi:MscS family membrane protein